MSDLKKITDLDVAKKLVAIKTSADSRGIHFDMSLRRVRQLLNTKKCYITGIQLSRDHKDPNQLTFDRLDNSKGYTDDNVVACSLRMNKLKDSLSIEEITMLYMAIQKKYKK
jgi:hypothetical protein